MFVCLFFQRSVNVGCFGHFAARLEEPPAKPNSGRLVNVGPSIHFPISFITWAHVDPDLF